MIWTVGFLLVWAPGFLLARALRVGKTEASGVPLALHVALGLSFWPILLHFTSLAGVRWTAGAGRWVAIVIIGTAILDLIRHSAWKRRGKHHLFWRARVLLPLAGLALLAVITRWLHIRGLSFPPWVDALHHGMIIRLIADQGGVPASLDPFVSGASFYYHWGYHATVTWLTWLLGIESPTALPRVLLDYGQMLNALTVVTMYAAGRVLLKSREAGLMAAALACFVSLYPAYYLSWGRYTHLAGTLMLPGLLILLARMGTSSRPWRSGIAVVIAAAGLSLVHVRIAFFAAAFMLVVAGVMLVRRRFRPVLLWLAAGAIAGLIVLPWFLHVTNNPSVQTFLRPQSGEVPDIHQAVPLQILWSRHNRELLAIATCGISGMAGWLQMPPFGRVLSGIWWLLLIWAARQPPADARARRLVPWRSLSLVGGCCALIAALLFVRLPFLDLTRFASVSSAAITLFIPLSLSGAALLSWFLQRTIRSRATATRAATALAFVLALYGAWTTAKIIVNPATVIAGNADARALAWIEKNVPPGSRFAVDARSWMTPSWVGVDGGYWIGVATSASSILPPSIYAWSMPMPAVNAINERLRLWSERDPKAWEALRRAGVTHVYTGEGADKQRCEVLSRDPRLRNLYRDGPVCVFAVAAPSVR